MTIDFAREREGFFNTTWPMHATSGGRGAEWRTITGKNGGRRKATTRMSAMRER